MIAFKGTHQASWYGSILLASFCLAAAARAESPPPPKNYKLDLEMFTVQGVDGLNLPKPNLIQVVSTLPTTGRVIAPIAVGVKKKPDGYTENLPALTWKWTSLDAGDNFEKISMRVNHTTNAGPFVATDPAFTLFHKSAVVDTTDPNSNLPGQIAAFTADFTVPGYYQINTLVTVTGTDAQGDTFKGTLRCTLPIITAYKVTAIIPLYLVPDMEGLSKVKILPEELNSLLTYTIRNANIIASATPSDPQNVIVVKAASKFGRSGVDIKIGTSTVGTIWVSVMGVEFADHAVVFGYLQTKRKLFLYVMPTDDDTASRASFDSDDVAVATVDPTLKTYQIHTYDRIGYIYVYPKDPGSTSVNAKLKVGPDLMQGQRISILFQR